ncbi:MAG: hypothetical protein GY874_21680 [Desulfobacteraceae bacterium]|nr:hypothetical protein [Desulfobacteraceae bacterium]
MTNLQKICHNELKGRYELKIVDVLDCWQMIE